MASGSAVNCCGIAGLRVQVAGGVIGRSDSVDGFWTSTITIEDCLLGIGGELSVLLAWEAAEG